MVKEPGYLKWVTNNNVKNLLF